MSLQRALENAVALAYRELLSLFVTPQAYVVGTLFLLLQGWTFSLLLNVLNDPLAAPGPVMQYYFGGSFFIFWLPVIFLCSTLSMRLVAEERRQGTLESLLTAPVSAAQVIVGKYVGVVTFYVLLWLPTSVFYVLLRGAAVKPDIGPVVSGYLGTSLVGATFLAIGLLLSAVSRTQLGASIATFVSCTILLLLGLLVDQVESPTVVTVLEQTSLLSMMQEMAQGIVDTRWYWLHGGVVCLALAAAMRVIDPRRTLESWLQWGLLAVAIGHLSWLGMRHSTRQDWTGGQVYSLSDRARTLLEQLEQPIDVRALVPSTIGAGRPNPLAQELREVLTRMANVQPQLKVRLLDPDRDRQDAEQLIADFALGGRDLADGVILIRSGQGAHLVRAHLLPGDLVTYATGVDVQATGPRVKEFRGEEALLAAFIRVSNPVDLTLCYSQGHGERRFDNLEPFAGYAHLKSLLTGAGLKVQVADLDGADGLRDCDVLLVAGPSGRLPKPHVEAIERYVETGGDILLLAGAVGSRSGHALAPHGLEGLMQRFGIMHRERIVIDPNHPMAGGTPLLSFTIDYGWGQHPAVRSLMARPVSMVFARELVLGQAQDGSTPDMLLQSDEGSWAESDIKGIRLGDIVSVDEDRDRRGPVVVAAAGSLGGARLIVISSDKFVVNAYLREDIVYDHGRDLVLNALGWLTEQDVLLGIRARERENVKLVLSADQLDRMVLVCVVGLPGFSVVLALWVLWWRRRR